MILFSRTGASVVQHEGVTYRPGPDGGFAFPDHVSDRLHPFAVRGQRMWETGTERQRRVMSEEMDRRRDPAELYDAVAKIVAAAEGRAEPQDGAPKGRAKAAAS